MYIHVLRAIKMEMEALIALNLLDIIEETVLCAEVMIKASITAAKKVLPKPFDFAVAMWT